MDGDVPILIPTEVWNRVRFYRRTRRILRFMRQHLSEGLTVEQAATIAGMQSSAFSRFFSQHIGVSFSEFAATYRVERALRRLAYTNAPIKQIAHAVGFGSISTFERRFRREVGMSPSRFRARALAAREIQQVGARTAL